MVSILSPSSTPSPRRHHRNSNGAAASTNRAKGSGGSGRTVLAAMMTGIVFAAVGLMKLSSSILTRHVATIRDGTNGIDTASGARLTQQGPVRLAQSDSAMRSEGAGISDREQRAAAEVDTEALEDDDESYLTRKDVTSPSEFFGANWWQDVEHFLNLCLDDMKIIEDGTYAALRSKRKVKDRPDWSRVRMTADWLDLNVEHWSKYIKMLDLDKDQDQGPVAYDVLQRKFQSYIDRIPNLPWPYQQGGSGSALVPESIATTQTIAIVTHGVVGRKGDAMSRSTKTGLRAVVCTLLSLWQIGIPRVLIVVQSLKEDKEPLLKVLDEVVQKTKERPLEFEIVTGVGDREQDLTPLKEYNIAKGAFRGLLWALSPSDSPPGSEGMDAAAIQQHRKLWLGENYVEGKFHYVYYTESDQVLNTRRKALPSLTRQLRLGRILSAHRLQVLPYQVCCILLNYNALGFLKDASCSQRILSLFIDFYLSSSGQRSPIFRGTGDNTTSCRRWGTSRRS